MTRCHIVPPYLLEQIALAPDRGHAVDPELVLASRETLQVDAALRDLRARPGMRAPVTQTGGFTVHTAANTAALPGRPVRDQDQEDESGDVAVDEAWEGVRASLEMFAEVYDRDSYDGRGARVTATVHYQRDYDNAFWDGSQLVFGDGDQRVFDRFTKAVDVLAHELSHAVTERTAGLVYQGQSGALNESMSDVFGSCLKQRVLGQTADEADWLIGAGLFMPSVHGEALRSMKAPGTAYDDPALGRDPQPGDMSGYVETAEDNGGVHINSGIPNRAFQLAATAIGGSSAEGAGRIWYAALLEVASDADFVTFAAATVAAAGDHADAVRSAWEEVGVTPAPTRAGPSDPGSSEAVDEPVPSDPASEPVPADEPAPAPAPARVQVSRSGGFAGLTVTRELDLSADDDRASEARALAGRMDFMAPSVPTHPDGFVYDFDVDGQQVTLPEQAMDDGQRRLARLVLDDGY